jgi:hypothetical protein
MTPCVDKTRCRFQPAEGDWFLAEVTLLVEELRYDSVILFGFTRARGIKQDAAGLHDARGSADHPGLQIRESREIPGRPRPLHVRIAPNGSQSTTGCIEQHTIELGHEWEIACGVQRKDRRALFVPELAQSGSKEPHTRGSVVCGDDHPCRAGLLLKQQRLSSRRGAQVENAIAGFHARCQRDKLRSFIVDDQFLLQLRRESSERPGRHAKGIRRERGWPRCHTEPVELREHLAYWYVVPSYGDVRRCVVEFAPASGI